MKVEAKGYKRINGHDGMGFECSIYVDGKRTCHIFDDGWGGEWQYTIFDQKRYDAMNERVTAMDPHIYEYEGDGGEDKSFTIDMSLDIWLDETVMARAEARGARKVMTLNSDDGKVYEWSITYKAKDRERLEAHIAKSKPTHALLNRVPAIVELA